MFGTTMRASWGLHESAATTTTGQQVERPYLPLAEHVHSFTANLRLTGGYPCVDAGSTLRPFPALCACRNVFPSRHSEAQQGRQMKELLQNVWIKAVFWILSGVGLLERQSWGRPFFLLLAIISLINLSFGTVIEVFTGWGDIGQD